jgi:hypothetical protein
VTLRWGTIHLSRGHLPAQVGVGMGMIITMGSLDLPRTTTTRGHILVGITHPILVGPHLPTKMMRVMAVPQQQHGMNHLICHLCPPPHAHYYGYPPAPPAHLMPAVYGAPHRAPSNPPEGSHSLYSGSLNQGSGKGGGGDHA